MEEERTVQRTPASQSVAQCLQIREPIQNIIIMKNGPSEGNWAEDLEMDMEKVARTIWWYIM